jgi:predicted NAD-dependent protein-ADP-ribosyltransferase YbiA (DUF1768 family)
MPHEVIRNLNDLRSAVDCGFRPRYLFFWGHKPLPNGEIGSSCLSQWWPAAFAINSITYPTAEHFMMAEKARLFGDEVVRSRILAAAGPRKLNSWDDKSKTCEGFGCSHESTLS